MINNLQQAISKTGFNKNHHYLLAVSGGLDSMVLLHLFYTLDLNFSVAHFNFELRGKDSSMDEKFVSKSCKDIGVNCFVRKENAELYAASKGISIQEAAREMRYKFFAELMKSKGISTLVTAHHLNDSVETFFINLNRSTGLKGLTGIPSNKQFFRPLLGVSRKDILAYSQDNKVVFREDVSNKDNKYLRNWYRNEVIPKMEEKNADILKSLQTSINYLSDSQMLLEELLEEDLKRFKKALKDGFLAKEEKLNFLAQKWLLLGLLPEYSFSNKQIIQLVECFGKANSGKQFLSPSHRIVIDRKGLFLEEISERNEEVFWIKQDVSMLREPIEISIKVKNVKENLTYKKGTDYLDFEKLDFPLQLRKWESGDSFKPLGMNGQKKLSDFFIDNKIPITTKENTWVLLSNDKIVSVLGHRISDDFKIGNKTKKVFQLQWA